MVALFLCSYKVLLDNSTIKECLMVGANSEHTAFMFSDPQK